MDYRTPPDSTVMRHPIHIIKQMQDIAASELPLGKQRMMYLRPLPFSGRR